MALTCALVGEGRHHPERKLRKHSVSSKFRRAINMAEEPGRVVAICLPLQHEVLITALFVNTILAIEAVPAVERITLLRVLSQKELGDARANGCITTGYSLASRLICGK